MAAPATTSSASSNAGTELRAGRISSMRDRMGKFGRGAMLGLSMLPTFTSIQREEESSAQRDPMVEMHMHRHAAQRYANPGAMTPRIQEMSNALREGGTDQEDDADEIDQQQSQIADESDAAESMQLAARARSGTKATADDATQKMVEQGLKKSEEFTEEIKADLTNKAMSLFDEGECAEVVDTAGVTLSVTRSTLSLFQDSLDERTKFVLAKMGFPMIKMGTGTGEIAVAGTVAQLDKWFTVIFVILPFLIIFQLLAYGSIASVIRGNISNAYALMQAAL